MEGIIIIDKAQFEAMMNQIAEMSKKLDKLSVPDEVLDTKQAAKFLCISTMVLTQKAQAGEIKGHKNGIWRFLKSDLYNYMQGKS